MDAFFVRISTSIEAYLDKKNIKGGLDVFLEASACPDHMVMLIFNVVL